MNLSNPIYTDADKAREHLEAQRWPNGPYCPRCGEAEKVTRLQGKSTAPGLCMCNSCRTKFSVTMGTVFERSHIPLSKWMLGFRLMASSKKGMSALQLQRMLRHRYAQNTGRRERGELRRLTRSNLPRARRKHETDRIDLFRRRGGDGIGAGHAANFYPHGAECSHLGLHCPCRV